MTDFISIQVYSTAIIGPGAKFEEQVRLFTTPIGQPLPTIGQAAPIQASEEHTNLYKAGEFGSALSDVVLKSIGAAIEWPGDSPVTPMTDAQIKSKDFLRFGAVLTFEVGGQILLKGPLQWFLERRLPVLINVAYCDCIIGRLDLRLNIPHDHIPCPVCVSFDALRIK